MIIVIMVLIIMMRTKYYDNDNDNEIFFIAKRYTVHHQHIDKGNNTSHVWKV